MVSQNFGRSRSLMIPETWRTHRNIRLGEVAGKPDSMAGASPPSRTIVLPQGARHAAPDLDPGPAAHGQLARNRRRAGRPADEPPAPRAQPVPAPARAQPGGLVAVGAGGVCPGEEGKQTNFPVDRLLVVPRVPRHGARVVR